MKSYEGEGGGGEPSYSSSLDPGPPGVEASEESGPAGGALGAHVGLGQQHSGLRQPLSTENS